VKDAAAFLAGRIPVCTVIGFPNGYSTPSAKVQETRQALEDGAEEIDMVINVAFLKDGRFDAVREEIGALRKETDGKILKVIVETCYLTEEEKIRMCKIVRDAGADYIKTSTGFGTGNATPEDVTLFARCLEGSNVKIKASGGIRTWEDAEMYLSLGADRLGSSALIKSLAD
jgi:deoxyribose-phosphate aldolase